MDNKELEVCKYKILKPIEYTNQIGEPQGMLEVGSVGEYPIALGKKWVRDGLAEKVVETPKPVETPKTTVTVKKVILKNVLGKEMNEADYFFAKDGNGKAPSYFNKICGNPVDREDVIEIFNKVFKVEDNFLLYKTTDKEVYIIIIPLKFATVVNAENESVEGDFQKHAISFVNEGSVNPETLKFKLKRIVPFCKFSDR